MDMKKHNNKSIERGKKEKKPRKEKNWKSIRRFEVKPAEIDRSIFERKREKYREEWTRQLILEAFKEVEANPERYGKPFTIVIPIKTWKVKSTLELKEMTTDFGGCMLNWVEQVLEWAQRIANGESWKKVCYEPDQEDCYRLIIWKDGKIHNVGGSKRNKENPMICIGNICYSNEKFDCAVPSVKCCTMA